MGEELRRREDEVLCAVCGIFATKGYTLKCGHLCCTKCANIAKQGRVYEAFSVGIPVKKGATFDAVIACCRCGVRTLSSQLVAPDVVEGDGRGYYCDVNGCGQIATVQCEQCGYLCPDHHELAHFLFPEHVKRYVKNGKEAISEAFGMRRCKKHRCDCEVYCADCKKQMCPDCLAKGTCVDHETYPLVMDGMVFDEGRRLISEIRQLTANVKRRKNGINEEIDRRTREIRNQFQMMHEQLNDEEDRIIELFDKIRDQTSEFEKSKQITIFALNDMLKVNEQMYVNLQKGVYNDDAGFRLLDKLKMLKNQTEFEIKALSELRLKMNFTPHYVPIPRIECDYGCDVTFNPSYKEEFDMKLTSEIAGNSTCEFKDDVMVRAINFDPVAQNEIGDRFFYGRGVERDKRTAFKWYQKAAEQGNGLAQCNVAMCYGRGEGVARDVGRFFDMLEKSAQSQCYTAQIALGVNYEKGIGVKQDLSKALSYFQMAAERNRDALIHDLMMHKSQFLPQFAGKGVRPFGMAM